MTQTAIRFWLMLTLALATIVVGIAAVPDDQPLIGGLVILAGIAIYTHRGEHHGKGTKRS